MTYLRRRGRRDVPGRLAGVYRGDMPVHAVVAVDLSGSLESLKNCDYSVALEMKQSTDNTNLQTFETLSF